MKIVRIKGGLGNQMFQYAFASKLKYLYPQEKILLDLTQFRGYKWHPYELKRVFDVDIPVASFLELSKLSYPFSSNTRIGRLLNGLLSRVSNKEKFEYSEKSASFDKNALRNNGNCYYNGYWLSSQYFDDLRPQLLQSFSFKPVLSDNNSQLKEYIGSCMSVSIHVRRGNYLLFDEYKDICEKPYYANAIKYIRGNVNNPHFFIFSNDIQWCKENLMDLMENYTFVDNNNPLNNYVDLQLMSCCKHNVIAHSTFSWWAAWLNQNPQKIVVAPRKWNNKYAESEGPQMAEWVLLDNE